MSKSEKESSAAGSTTQPVKFCELPVVPTVKPHVLVRIEIGSMVFENRAADPRAIQDYLLEVLAQSC